MNDIQITCGCGAEFTWTKGEQEFMEKLREEGKLDEKDQETGVVTPGQVNQPKRCPDCRASRKNQRGADNH